MTDTELLHAAMEAAQITDPVTGRLSVRGFARAVGGDVANTAKVDGGTKGLSPAARVLYMLLVMRPDLTESVALAAAQVRSDASGELTHARTSR